MNYKKAKIDDLPAIMALVNDAVKNLQKHGNMQWDERYPLDIDFIPEIEAGTQTLVYINDRLAGVYSLSTEHDEQYDSVRWSYEYEPFMVLHRFILHPDFQGKGLSTKMLAHIIGELKDRGINNIRLDTYKENSASQHLYRKFGFVDVGVAYFRDKPFDLMELHF